MTNSNNERKKPALDPELYKRNPTWFRGAVAHRLLRLMTPKPLSRRLPVVLRKPLLSPGFTFPPGWSPGDPLPPGLDLPLGIWFPPGWSPGDPLPEEVFINTLIYFTSGWTLGDPLPPSLILPEGISLPSGWSPGDPLPSGSKIDTSIYFPTGWLSGDSPPAGAISDPIDVFSYFDIPSIVPPNFISFADLFGPVAASKTSPPLEVWIQIFDGSTWEPDNRQGTWDPILEQWVSNGTTTIWLPVGTWHYDYRPKKIRVTHNGDENANMCFYDIFERNISVASAYPSGSPISCTWYEPGMSGNLYQLYVEGPWPDITNVEFSVP